MKKQPLGIIVAGVCAGAINGLFGAGGGMVLVPLLTSVAKLDEDSVFPCSVSMILPICLVSLSYSLAHTSFTWTTAIPYLISSVIGGVIAGIWGKKIPTLWLHRILSVLILWGGYRYLC